MKVTVSVGGKFHAFYLARQLYNRGYLKQLITSYPKPEAVKYGIDKNYLSTVIIKEVLGRSWSLLPYPVRKLYNPQYAISEIFDRAAKRHLIGGDILVAWSSFALHTMRKAKQLGMITVLERGSSHILHQSKILKEEYERCGIMPQSACPKIIEKELREYEEADYVSVPSSFAKKTFLDEGYPEEKVVHIPYGADINEFNPIPKEDKTFRIIYCGGINLRKGVHYLLKAFYELNLPGAELWLIGRISEEIKPFIKKYDSGKVFCKGPYAQSELYKYYSQGSVFAIMSVEEGMAMVMLQAMACGLPVICTNNTGGEDIIRGGVDGFTIFARDVEKLKEKLIYMYENQNICKNMGRNARERAGKEFTWDNYGERIANIYERLCNGRLV